MSLQSLKREDLLAVAEYFAVELEGENPTKNEVLAALAAGKEPVTWEQYKSMFLPNQKVDSVEANQESSKLVEDTSNSLADGKILLIKMERANTRYDIRGYTFTKEHPIRPVDEESAEYILEHEEGFRQARPSELEEYYS